MLLSHPLVSSVWAEGGETGETSWSVDIAEEKSERGPASGTMAARMVMRAASAASAHSTRLNCSGPNCGRILVSIAKNAAANFGAATVVSGAEGAILGATYPDQYGAFNSEHRAHQAHPGPSERPGPKGGQDHPSESRAEISKRMAIEGAWRPAEIVRNSAKNIYDKVNGK